MFSSELPEELYQPHLPRKTRNDQVQDLLALPEGHCANGCISFFVRRTDFRTFVSVVVGNAVLGCVTAFVTAVGHLSRMSSLTPQQTFAVFFINPSRESGTWVPSSCRASFFLFFCWRGGCFASGRSWKLSRG